MSSQSTIVRSIAGLAGLLVLPSIAHAQWTYEILHPSGAHSSKATQGTAAAQGGTVQLAPGVNHAAVWNGSAASFVDLHVAGFASSNALDCDGTLQVGSVSNIGGNSFAAMWSGSPGSYSDLHPAGYTDSILFSVDGSQQGGIAILNGLMRPALWHGTAASFVDMTPPGYFGTGFVFDIAGGQQVGSATQSGAYRAGLWTGTAASWVELAVGGVAYGTDGVQQVGYAPLNGGARHACLWSGSAASVVDLAPANSTESTAYDVDAGEQVGAVTFPFLAARAYLWSGTAASGQDLHNVLPPAYIGSTATGIWHANGTTYVLGTAITTTPGATHTVLWRRMHATTYCAGKQNSVGCTPSMSFLGSPSASGNGFFSVRAGDVRNQVPGLLLYGASGRNAIPFAGGTLCVGQPLFRSPGLNSSGSNPPAANCSGVFFVDMHAFRVGQLGGNPQSFLSIPGTIVNCQYWGRDPGFAAPNNVQLSNALEYEIGI